MPPKRKKAAPKGRKKTKAAKTQADADDSEVEIVQVVERRKTGFMDLPNELRNPIYEFALIRNGCMMVPDRREKIEPSGNGAPPVVLHEPALLATCREIRSVATPIFYANNTFAAKYALYGVKLLKQLGPERTAMLTALRACGQGSAFISSDRFMHATVKHVNSLFEVADGTLSADAVIVPADHRETGGWQKLTDAKDIRIVKDGERISVEWTGRKELVDMAEDMW